MLETKRLIIRKFVAADLEERYPRFGDFVALRDKLDPSRTFGNPHLEQVLGS